MSKSSFYLTCLIGCLMLLSGCATTPGMLPSRPQFNVPGVYHHVERGETLWRISRIYGVDMDEIVRINRIPDAASIEQGQLVFIPSAQRKPQPSKYPSSEEFGWPLKGRVIANFGQTYNDTINKGINIQRTRSADILASRSGKVVFYSPDFERFGKTVIIDHGDGFSTVYAGNSEVFVKAGDHVGKEAVIASLRAPGGSANAYLHFEVRKGHIPQNPYFYLP